jgi:hypothetical protein
MPGVGGLIMLLEIARAGWELYGVSVRPAGVGSEALYVGMFDRPGFGRDLAAGTRCEA